VLQGLAAWERLGLAAPPERPCWSVGAARAVYEPALLRAAGALLAARAEPDGAEPDARSPLMCCAMAGWASVAAALLAARADVGRADAAGPQGERGRGPCRWAARG